MTLKTHQRKMNEVDNGTTVLSTHYMDIHIEGINLRSEEAKQHAIDYIIHAIRQAPSYSEHNQENNKYPLSSTLETL